MELTTVETDEYVALIDLWEASVRATHDFLQPGDVEFYRRRMPEYLRAVRLVAVRHEGRIAAFLGTLAGGIEMLFVHPDFRGCGMGARLVRHAVGKLGCRRVEVNEQNGQAVGFYGRMGFRIIGRAEVDAEGKPYPLLCLLWAGDACGAGE